MVKNTLFHVVASTRCKNFRSLDDVETLINCETSISVLPLRNEYSQAFSYQFGGLTPPGPLSATNVRQKASGTGWERSDQPASLLHSRGMIPLIPRPPVALTWPSESPLHFSMRMFVLI